MENDYTKNRSSEYFALNDQIEQELRALDDNIGILPEGELDGKTYDRYIGHFNYVKGLLDKASVLVCSLVFSQEDPELHRLLEARRNIDLGLRYYNTLRSNFCRSHLKEVELSEEEREFERVREVREEPPVEEEEPADAFAREAEPAEDDLLRLEEEEAALAAAAEEEEKEARKAASRDRQARLAREGKAAELREAEQHRARLEEAARLSRGAAAYSPEAPIAEADLAAERMRQMDEQNRLAREAEERLRRERESLNALREREERAAKYESFGNSHIDFSHGRSGAVPGGYSVGDNRETADGGREAARPFWGSESDPNRQTPAAGNGYEQVPSPQIVDSGGVAVTAAEREHRIHTYGATATDATIRDAEMREREAHAREAALRARALEESRAAMRHTSERISRSENYESFGSSHIDFSHGRSGAVPGGNSVGDNREPINYGREAARPTSGGESYPDRPSPDAGRGTERFPPLVLGGGVEMSAAEREARARNMAERIFHPQNYEDLRSRHRDLSSGQNGSVPGGNPAGDSRETAPTGREAARPTLGGESYPDRPVPNTVRGAEHIPPQVLGVNTEMSVSELEARARYMAERISRLQNDKDLGSRHMDLSSGRSSFVPGGNSAGDNRDSINQSREAARPTSGGESPLNHPAPNVFRGAEHIPPQILGVNSEMSAAERESRARYTAERISRSQNDKDPGGSRTGFSPQHPEETRSRAGDRPAAQSYLPGGEVGSMPDLSPKQHISSVLKDRPVFDNVAIYSTLKAGISAAGNTPVTISPAYAYQMERNLELARAAYHEARYTPEAKQAAHVYAQQRRAYASFQARVRAGRLVYDSTEAPAPVKAAPNAERGRTACDYTPDGVRGFGVDSRRLGSSSFTQEKDVKREQLRYSAASPLRVTPAYEQAMRDRLSRATAAINSVVKDGKTLKISRDAEAEFLLASNAFRGYERAKNEGCVIVTEEAGAKKTPDFAYWQDRHYFDERHRRRNENRKSSGTSATGRFVNPNAAPRRETEEKSSSIFQKGGILRRAKVAFEYAKYAAAGAGDAMLQGYREIGSRTFNLVDRSDDSGTIHLSRQSWRYAATVLGVGNAVLHSRITNSVALGRTITRAEAVRFGALSGMTAKELHQRSTSLRERVNALEDRIIGLKGKGSLTPTEAASVKQLEFEWKRRKVQLSEIQGYQEFLRDSRGRVSVHKALEDSLPPLTTKTQLRREIRRLTTSEKELFKGFWGREGERVKTGLGKMQTKLDGLDKQIRILEVKRAAGKAAGFSEADRQELLKLKDKRNAVERKMKGLSQQERALKADARLSLKDLPKQKAMLEAKVKGMKAQLRALELKGKLLTPAERRRLAALRENIALTSFRLKNLNRLSRDAANIRTRRSELNLLHKKLEKNRFAYRRLGGSLFELLSKPIRDGSEEGAQGILTLTNAATNRHIHRIAKLSLKGMKKTASAGRLLVRTTGRAGVAAAKTVGLTETAAGKTVAKAATKIKTQVNRVNRGAAKVKTAAKDVKAGLGAPVRAASGLRLRVMNRFYDTKVGAAAAKVGSFFGKIGDGARAVFSFAKGTAVKLLLAFGIFFLIIAAVGGSGSFLGGSAGSVILSPDESNGKIDLSSYVAVIQEEQQKFDDQISELQGKRKYDSVSIEYATATMNNTKEMLSMMAVRMGQDLDMKENPDVKNYLISLYHDSHFYTTNEYETFCSGCVTKTRLVTEKVINEETGKEETVTRVEEYKYCPGHWHLEISISILGFDEIFTADSMGNAGASVARGGLIGRFYITYYQDTVEDQEQWVGQTATGVPPKPNHTIAVDPSVIPLGTHVIIRGKEYVAEDVGGAINGYHIDMFLAPGPLPENLHNEPVYYASYEGEGVQESGDWNGWTAENIAWCKAIYSPNWAELYNGITSDTGGVIENGDLIVEGNFVWPVTTTTTSSGFGWRTDPITGERAFHKGTDIPVPTGTPIHAAADGTVAIAQYSNSAGNYIKLNHANNVSTRYLHCSQLLVRPGQQVKAGDVIAYSGNTGWSTGPHLHFEFLVNGQAVNPRTQYGLN